VATVTTFRLTPVNEHILNLFARALSLAGVNRAFASSLFGIWVCGTGYSPNDTSAKAHHGLDAA
jgi:hypothetical protein